MTTKTQLDDQANNEILPPVCFLLGDGGSITIPQPEGYTLALDGLYFNRKRICTPLWVDSITSCIDQDGFGIRIGIIDLNGQLKYESFDRSLLSDTKGTMLGKLQSLGVIIFLKGSKAVMSYLTTAMPEKRIVTTKRTGWLTRDSKPPSYVFPDEILGNGNDELSYQSDSTQHKGLVTKGSLGDWNKHIARKCLNNPYLVFMLGVSLSAPLLKILKLEGGGFHLFGLSSRGKTTAAQVAASVIGNGSDPAVDSTNSYVQGWNTTANGLETLACDHNDLPLILDELGTSSVSDLGAAIYNITKGKGKARMVGKSLEPFLLVLISTGEFSVRYQVQKSSGKNNKLKAGQQIRCIDLPISDEGIISNTQGIEPAIFASSLKEACGEYYGTCGRAFINALVNKLTEPQFSHDLLKRFTLLQNQYCNEDLSPEQQRAIKRFALAELAGCLAVEFGIISLPPEQFKSASHNMFETWLDDCDMLSDIDRGIEHLKRFIITNPNKFVQTKNQDSPKHAIAGYQHINGEYLLLPHIFEKIIGSVCPKAIAKELSSLGYLIKSDGNRLKSRYQITHLGGKISCYAVKPSLVAEVDLPVSETNNSVFGALPF